MGNGRGDAERGIGGKGKKALGVGVGFSECMHTWGMIEIGGCMSNTRKSVEIKSHQHIRASNHKNRTISCSTMPSILPSGLDSASCPMLRSLDAQTLLKDLRSPPVLQCNAVLIVQYTYIRPSPPCTYTLNSIPLPYPYSHTKKMTTKSPRPRAKASSSTSKSSPTPHLPTATPRNKNQSIS